MFTLSPAWLSQIFAVLMGLVVGSFLNVVIARVPRRKSLVRPGSHCPKCGKPIRWYDNIPLLSFVLLRGRCRECGTAISIRYPIVEFMTALLYLATEMRFGLSPLLFVRDWPFIGLLIAITFIDLDRRIIPDRLTLPGLVLGLASAGFVPGLGWTSAIVGAAAGFGVFYFFAWLYHALTGQSGLGGGDIKLLAMLGAFLGPGGVFAAILISSIFGSVVGIIWALATRKRKIMKTAIPYGPFLVFGGLYYYLLGDVLWLRFTIPT